MSRNKNGRKAKSLFIEESLYEELSIIAIREKITKSDALNNAIDHYIEYKKEKAKSK